MEAENVNLQRGESLILLANKILLRKKSFNINSDLGDKNIAFCLAHDIFWSLNAKALFPFVPFY